MSLICVRFLEAVDDFSKNAVQEMNYNWAINYLLDGKAEEIPKEEYEKICLSKQLKSANIKKEVAKKSIEIDEFKKKAKRTFTKPNWIDLIKEIEDELPIYYDKNNMWWLWNEEENKWEISDETDIFVLLIDHFKGTDLTDPKTKSKITNALKLVGRQREIIVPKPNWVQFKNKIIDCFTMEEIEPDMKYFFTNPISYSISDDDSTPVIDKLFNEWVEKKYVPMLYEIIAYSFYRDYPIHRIFCFTGSGRNGKSKYLGLISNLLGDNNTTTSDLDLLMSRPFESFKLYKKLICQMGETNYEGLKRTAILKQLSGQDLISYEKKGKDGFTDYNYAKLMISTNGIPITHDKSDGFYRRWLIVDFPNNFPEGKDILKSIPDEEYNNLCRKCINMLPKLLEDGKFTNEPSIEEKKQIYEEKSNPLVKFLKEKTCKDFHGYLFKYELNNSFSAWLNLNGYRNLTNNEINALMREAGYEDGKKYTEPDEEGKTSQFWAWIGISWYQQSKESKQSNTFKLETDIEKQKENTGLFGLSGLSLSIKLILGLVKDMKEEELIIKLREINTFEYNDFVLNIEKLIEVGEIIEVPKGTYKRI